MSSHRPFLPLHANFSWEYGTNDIGNIDHCILSEVSSIHWVYCMGEIIGINSFFPKLATGAKNLLLPSIFNFSCAWWRHQWFNFVDTMQHLKDLFPYSTISIRLNKGNVKSQIFSLFDKFSSLFKPHEFQLIQLLQFAKLL